MEPNQILQQAEKALRKMDAESLVASYAQDFILEDASSGKQISNKAELRAYYDRLFSMPEVAFSDVSFFASGGRAAGRWTWHGVSPSGGKFAIRGASLFKLAADGIKEEILFYDPKPASE
jgi:hypothetical protein